MLEKLKKKDLIQYMILLMPLIDVFNTITGFSLSLIYRGIFLVILLFIFLFLNKSKIKNISFCLLIILAVFSFVFLFNYYLINGFSNFILEFITLIKFLYLPILTLCLINYYEDKKYSFKDISMKLVWIYTIFLFIPTILGIGTNSYAYGKSGFTGLFYAPNEVGAILAILSPFAIFNIQNKDHKLINILIAILFIISIFLMGTKTPVIGLFITLLCVFIVSVIRELINKKNIKNVIINILLIILSIFIYNNSYLLDNLNLQDKLYDINNNDKGFNSNYNENLYDLDILKENNYLINFPTSSAIKNLEKIDNKFLNLVFSSRNVYMTENLNAYINASNAKKTFGLSLYGSSEKVSGKLAELDFIDIFTNYGIIGFIVLTIYLFLILIIIIIKFLKDFKNNILDDEVCSNCLSFSIAILISLTAGHVLGAPAVSTILSLTMVYLIKKFNLFKDNKLIDIILILISAFYLLLAITYLCIPYNNSIVKINIINNDITIENNVKLVESKEITYNNIKDKLFYYVPTDNKRFKIIYVKRIFENNDEINFLTFNNEEDKNILVQMTILNDYSKYEETANGLLIESDQNILISNSYHYNNITNNVKKFNKNAAKNLLKEQIDFSRNNGQVRKNINIKSNTSVDSYIIVSNNDLINKNEIIPWLSYNGTYERKTDSIYTKTLDNINLDYSLEYFNNLLIKNYLITLNKYSNNQNNIWYKDYEIDNESNVSHNDIYLDFGLNYDIYSNLELFNIKTSSIYENISNILLKELDAGNYIETKNGIIFNKYIEPTFNNQIAILNILLKDYNNNKRYRIKNLINNLLSELENDNWVFNDNIHEYLTEEKTYQGEIKDFNIISDLISLNENLHNVYIYNSKIDNYINILYLKFKDNISGDILTKLKNYGYIS